MEISINRALSELKLLDKKIKDKIPGIQAAATVKTTDDEALRKAFIEDQSAKLQQVQDLISRRNKIKTAIVASNASTYVEVANEKMTVAAAIERKSSIELDKQLNKQLRQQFYGNKNNVDQHNDRVRQQADKQAESVLGAETAREKGEEYTAFSDAYYKRNKAELISINDLDKLIERTQDEIDEFESEVDFVLSESNTKTLIEV